MKKLILGTAGHIDHGKTALVKALTGVDTDRLPEEKQRGITIDLGFAHLSIGTVSLGVVDVPGHEGFVRNMLAGATGMDVVLLVIAADEGVMPQTREHLAILDLLDVRRGVIALTKCDLVSEEWTQLVVDDVRTTLRDTALRDVPIVPVSAVTGSGLDHLRAAILEQAAQPIVRRSDDVFRLPVDRVFTVRGTGTVVTGTVWSGTVSVDDTVVLLPPNVKARVRAIEVHGEAVQTTAAGERAALALAGVDRSSLARGVAAVAGAPWTVTRMLTVHGRVIAGTDWSLTTRQRVHVHIGTAEILARVVLLDADVLNSGNTGWLQLRLEEPVVARVGDRLVLRSYSPVTTIAGGIVAEIAPGKRKRLSAHEKRTLERILSGSPTESLAAVIDSRGVYGIRAAEVPLQTPHGSPADEGGNAGIRIGDSFFSGDVVRITISGLVAAADDLHRANPLRRHLDRAELRRAVKGSPELIERALILAIEAGELVSNGRWIARTGFEPRLDERQTGLRAAILSVLRQAALASPTVAEILPAAGSRTEVQSLIDLLEAEGLITAVGPDLYVDSGVLRQAVVNTRDRLAGSGQLSAADFRVALPVSRRHLIPLLEYFDRAGVTARKGDLRTVLPTSESG